MAKLKPSRDIRPVTAFRANAAQFIEQVQFTGSRHLAHSRVRPGRRAYYQQYLGATSIGDVNTYGARADNARRQTDVLIMQASALWLGAAAEATWYQWRLGRRLRFAALVWRPMRSR